MSRIRDTNRSELGRRIIVAVPVAAVLVGVVILSQTLLAAMLLVFGWICLYEFCKLEEKNGRFEVRYWLLSCAVIAGLIAAARYGDLQAVVIVLAGSYYVLLVGAAWVYEGHAKAHIERLGTGSLGLLWIGLPLAGAILLRGMHHGSWLVVDVLLAVSASDTGAYLGGKAFGRHPLASKISPNKTVEGWVIGILTAVVAVYLLSLFQSWLPTWQALVFGLVVAVVSSLGDLLESFIKRRAGVKDSGMLFGAHGGALDRADASLFGVVAGYGLAQLFGL